MTNKQNVLNQIPAKYENILNLLYQENVLINYGGFNADGVASVSFKMTNISYFFNFLLTIDTTTDELKFIEELAWDEGSSLFVPYSEFQKEIEQLGFKLEDFGEPNGDTMLHEISVNYAHFNADNLIKAANLWKEFNMMYG